jgi:ketosteroid isomerase-like protein
MRRARNRHPAHKLALFYHLRDGHIHRCDEYMDGASLPDMSFLASDETQQS